MGKLISFLKKYALRHWKYYLVGLVSIYITNALTVFIPSLIKQILDRLSQKEPYDDIIKLVWMLIVSSFGVMIIRTISRLSFFTPGRIVEHEYKTDLFSHILKLPQRFFNENSVGDIMSKATNDLQSVRALIGFAFLQILEAIFVVPMTIYQMWLLIPDISIYISLFLFLGFSVICLIIYRAMIIMRQSMEQLGKLSNQILDTYTGIQVIQSFCAEPAFLSSFRKLNNQYVKSGLQAGLIRTFLFPIMGLLGTTSSAIVLYYGGKMVLANATGLGTIVAYTGYITILVTKMMAFAWTLGVFQRGIVSLARIESIFSAKTSDNELIIHSNFSWLVNNTIRDSSFVNASFTEQTVEQATKRFTEEKIDETEIRNNLNKYPFLLEIKNLNYSYNVGDERKQSLVDINLKLKSGEKLGIFGKTGSGKSTLLNLISRYYEPPANSIFVNGVDISTISLKDWRYFLSIVPQEAFLFSDTLKTNLEWTKKIEIETETKSISKPIKPSDEELLNYVIDYADLKKDIDNFQNGLNTVVGQRGVMLSGGQRQRVSFARALYTPSAILLLDDLVSALDHETEKKIISALYKKNSEGSFIIVSHRISALKSADVIIVLEDGKIIDSGSHKDLISREGQYRDAYILQSEKDIEETKESNSHAEIQ